MATFYECPPVVLPTNDTITVTTNAQLRQAIDNREAGFGPVNIIANGTFQEVWVDGANGCHIWLTPGSSFQYQGGTGVAGSTVVRFTNCNDVGLHGVNNGGLPENLNLPEVDGNSTGNNGGIWGVVFGASFAGDPFSGPVTNGIIEGVSVHDVQQETMVINLTGTADVEVLCNEVYNTGRDLTNTFLGEGIYFGAGAGPTQFVDRALIQGNYIHDIQSGEGIDIKRGARNIRILDNLIDGVRLPFNGGITFWSDQANAGSPGNSIISRNRIFDVLPSPNAPASRSDPIQVGDAVTITNNLIAGFTGRGINVVRQFAGPEKLVVAEHNTIDATGALAAFSINATAPNGGNSPGQLETCGNLYVGNYLEGTPTSPMNDQAYSSGFVGPPGANGTGYALQPNTVHVDSAPNCGVSLDICLTSRPTGTSPDWGAFEIQANDEPVILANDSYGGTVGQPFSANALFNDPNLGDPTTVCSPISGSLPPGLIWNNGILSGTPTTAGTFTIQYQCVDSDGDSDTATIQFFIDDAPVTGGQLRCILT